MVTLVPQPDYQTYEHNYGYVESVCNQHHFKMACEHLLGSLTADE